MNRSSFVTALALCIALAPPARAAGDAHMAFIDSQIAANIGKTGVYVLDTGTEALLAGAWPG